MFSDSFMKNKRNRFILIFISFSFIMFLSTFIDGAYENYSPPGEHQLSIHESMHFPIEEISGMSFASNSSDVFVVGDKHALIGRGSWDGTALHHIESIDFTDAILKKFSVCESDKIPDCKRMRTLLTSQWEAITTDHKNLLYLLHEQLASIFVYSLELNDLVHVMNLESFDVPSLKKIKRKHTNSLGEGFVLLNNGHILLMKEDHPASIIEYGYQGENAYGYSQALRLQATKDFPKLDGQKTKMVPLKMWKLADHFRKCDLSELSTDTEGHLFALSQRCRWIGQLNDLSPEHNHMHFANTWNFPAHIKSAEAFLIPDANTFILAQDLKSTKQANMFVLKITDAHDSLF